ncbi:MAG: hypothetical protein WCC84_11020 [Candidatus Cybelea sp.]
MNEELILAPEVQARRVLRDRRIRLQVLVPHGPWIGCGALRVLRVKMNEPGQSAALSEAHGAESKSQDDTDVELIVGYESYTS